ncbi:hypothetical protein [Paludisphaera mucosa]|uniref:Uncharacterized protein n=1 Tax=Paludisphaera mucosa TaxID=3030827 RepID=A0ABT6F730_9BACT|nr:hypothetical protein [Paludisphaera mucosa]MDG3003332.1 hypothetical protein [Paludisphaera mucosa]
MTNETRSQSPTVVLRISDGSRLVRQAFADFGQASRSAEAYAREGFVVDMMSATGLFIMDFETVRRGLAV